MTVYIVPADMEDLYDEQILVQATNYSDRKANTVNIPILARACDAGNRIVDGHLLGLGIAVEKFSPRFEEIIREHAARLAMDKLAGTDPQIREHAKESIEWLKSLAKMDEKARKLLIQGITEDETPIDTSVVLPVVSFYEGDRWRVDF